MVITHHGGQCFKVTFGETTVVFDPVSKGQKAVPPVKFGADIAFISLWHPLMNGVEEVTYGQKEPFVISGPGEYEVGVVTARGFGVPTRYDGADKIATLYSVSLEDMNLVFLGPLGSEALDPQILGEIDDIDVLFLPIGGGDVLDVPAASKLATKLEAKCIIPMHYDATALKAFLKEEGADGVKPMEKLTLKKKDVAVMESEIVILSS
jgi:L-ascorbate metabolism protein UlaG (beta-lactamase superfamily)